MKHMFDVDIAEKYGVNAAILLENLGFWIKQNEANQTNYFDGLYWTYNSRRAFAELFPYLSEKQVNTALQKLIADDLIVTGNYNKSPYDRTLWYAITQKGKELLRHGSVEDGAVPDDKREYSIYPKCQMEEPKMSNEYPQNVRPIPDINTDINTDINADILRGAKKAPRRPSAEPAVITLILNDKTEYPVIASDVKSWSDLYPAVDVMQELRKMKGWLDANPSKRKTKAGVKRFINSWLSREQDRGHSGQSVKAAMPAKKSDLDEFFD